MGKFKLQMDEQMSIRGFSNETKKSYLGCMKAFVRYFMTSPEKLTTDHINEYQVYLVKKKKISVSTFNQHMCAIKFFYENVLKVDWDVNLVQYQKKAKKLPVVLNKNEVHKF